MIAELPSREEFLRRNRIDDGTWAQADIGWDVLRAIAADHLKQTTELDQAAELFASLIQRHRNVHSVRWRVKHVEHLLEKIVRKRVEGSEKYSGINPDNYFEIVTDLVGIRVLHLFKEDCFGIGEDLIAKWVPVEKPVAYIRTGDRDELKRRFDDQGFEIKEHPAGYRSVHYVFSSQPLRRKILTEVQIRTIFEEGWSEIDHRIRYPNFSDNELVEYFLTIFNRLAGSADEMGEFVRGLVENLDGLEAQIADAQERHAATLLAMEQTLAELEKVREQDKVSQDHIAKLKAEVSKLKDATPETRGPANGLVGVAIPRSSSRLAAELARRGLGTIAGRDIAKLAVAEKLGLGGVHHDALDALKVVGPTRAAAHLAKYAGLVGQDARTAASRYALPDAALSELEKFKPRRQEESDT